MRIAFHIFHLSISCYLHIGTIIIFILGQYKRFSKLLVHIQYSCTSCLYLRLFFVQLHCTQLYTEHSMHFVRGLRCFIPYLLPTTVWVNEETVKRRKNINYYFNEDCNLRLIPTTNWTIVILYRVINQASSYPPPIIVPY